MISLNIKKYSSILLTFGLIVVATGSAELSSTPSADLSATQSANMATGSANPPQDVALNVQANPAMAVVEKDTVLPDFEDKLSDKTDSTGTYFVGEIVVKFKDTASNKDELKLIRKNGLKIKRITDSGALILKVNAGDELKMIDIFKKDKDVEFADLDYAAKLQGVGGGGGGTPSCSPNDPKFCQNLQPSLTQLGVPAGWVYNKGLTSSVTIAIIDSGVNYNHEDLRDKIWTNPGETGFDAQGRDKRFNGVDDDGNGKVDDWRGWNFTGDGQYPNNNPLDDSPIGHGTAVAGVAAAKTDNGLGIAGISWGAKIMPLRVTYASGSVNSQLAADAVRYAVDEGAKVINISSNQTEEPTSTYRDNIKYAQDHGVVVVASTAYYNYDQNCFIGYPAGYTDVIAVQGVNWDGYNVAGCANTNSSYTPIRVSAYSANVMTTTKDGGYAVINPFPSTSLAAPAASGIASVLVNCYANYYRVRESFKYGGLFGTTLPNYNKYGWNIVNLQYQLQHACGY